MKKGITGAKAQKKSGISKHTAKSVVLNSSKLPISIKSLIAYCIFIGFFFIGYFIIGIYAPATLFFGKLVQGYAAITIDLLLIIILSFVIYGLAKREKWAYKLTIGWFIFGILNSLISLIVISPGLIKDLVFVSFIAILFIDGLVLWYLFKKKDYFYSKTFTHEVDSKDKFFMYSLSTLWIIIILVSIFLGLRFYHDTTEKADVYINELRGVSKLHGTVICDIKEGDDRDLCFMVLANIYQKEDMSFVCERISSDFYRFMCENT